LKVTKAGNTSVLNWMCVITSSSINTKGSK